MRSCTRPALAREQIVDLAHGAGAAIPQDAQDGQLGVGRSRGGVRVMGRSIYDNLRSVNENFRRAVRWDDLRVHWRIRG